MGGCGRLCGRINYRKFWFVIDNELAVASQACVVNVNPRNGHVRSIGREFLCAKRPEPIRPVADVVLFTVLFIHK